MPCPMRIQIQTKRLRKGRIGTACPFFKLFENGRSNTGSKRSKTTSSLSNRSVMFFPFEIQESSKTPSF